MTSWQYWHYCPCADPTTTGSGSTQALVLDPARPPTGDNVARAKLAVLSRAYPQAVAGTPERYRFDAARKRFDMNYSTERLGGGALRQARRHPGLRAAPPFPSRLRRARSPAARPSRRRARQHLVVRTCRGRPKVTIAVTAGSGRRAADCRAPRYGPERFRLKVSPRRVRAGRRVRLRLRATERPPERCAACASASAATRCAPTAAAGPRSAPGCAGRAATRSARARRATAASWCASARCARVATA